MTISLASFAPLTTGPPANTCSPLDSALLPTHRAADQVPGPDGVVGRADDEVAAGHRLDHAPAERDGAHARLGLEGELPVHAAKAPDPHQPAGAGTPDQAGRAAAPGRPERLGSLPAPPERGSGRRGPGPRE